MKIRRKSQSLLIYLSLFVTLISIVIIYSNLKTESFYPNVYKAYTLPEEALKILENPITNISLHFKIPILLYHYVEYVKDPGDTIRISLNIQPFILEQQLKTLKNAGYTFITPSQIPQFFDGSEKIPDKPIILSFDDGYKDFYTDVYPLLKKYKAKAVAYIVPGFLDKPNNLSTSQLREVNTSGLVEIGAHTMYHWNLKGLGAKEVKFEVEKSKEVLEKILGIKITSFAYPNGEYDLSATQVVKNAGFKTAVSTVSGDDVNLNNLYFLYRIRPGVKTGESLLKIL